jgi:predicted transposase YdaD
MAKRAAGRRQAGTGSLSASTRLHALEVQVEENRRDLELQFRRIAQMQAELDFVKQAWAKVKGAASP